MARHNEVHLYARVHKKPVIAQDTATGEYLYAMGYVNVVRGYRDAHDNLNYLKHDYPLVLSRDNAIIEEMSTWEENDIVVIKGAISSKSIPKKTFCPNCTGEDGKPTKNEARGNLLYVTPIHAIKLKHYEEKMGAVEDIVKNREISNQISVLASLIRPPHYFKNEKGLVITQYPIAINRKFHIKTDDPCIKTDFPYVTSYGEQAVEDKLRLNTGSDVMIDGLIQSRKKHRKTKCKCCGAIYEWTDNNMEIVPYAVEYIRGTYKTDEDLEAENAHKAEELRQMLFNGLINDEEEDEDSETAEDVSAESE